MNEKKRTKSNLGFAMLFNKENGLNIKETDLGEKPSNNRLPKLFSSFFFLPLPFLDNSIIG